MRPFQPRETRYVGLRSRPGWRLKLFSVRMEGPPMDWAGFEPALERAVASLPEPDDSVGRPGLGFLIAHQGLTGDYTVLAWWNHENELPVRVWVRRGGRRGWREALEGESMCVWDLAVVWEERQAWIDTMLSPTGPDPEAYLERIPERFRS